MEASRQRRQREKLCPEKLVAVKHCQHAGPGVSPARAQDAGQGLAALFLQLLLI